MQKFFNNIRRFISEKKMYFVIAVVSFIAGVALTGLLFFVGTRPDRLRLKQIRDERDTAIERYRELEDTVTQLKQNQSEYERFYINVTDTVTRIGETNTDSLSTIAGLKQIVTALRDTVQSFEDNSGSRNTSEFNNGNSNRSEYK